MEYVFLNLAWILALAVPMAILVSTLMAFGRLSSDNEITSFKASGISYLNLLKPGLIFGILIVMIMIPFNLWILPEMNHNDIEGYLNLYVNPLFKILSNELSVLGPCE